MKITKELDSVIKRTFDAQRNKVTERQHKETETYRKQRVNNVTSSETYKNFVRYLKLFKQLCANNNCDYSTNKNGVDVYYRNYGAVAEQEKAIKEVARNECLAIDRQREGLMIKLQYEKDLGVITELLGEYGIKI